MLLLPLMPAKADLRVEPTYVDVEPNTVMKCIKTVDYQDKVTYWIEGMEDSDGNQTLDAVKPKKFTLVEDLGEVEMNEVISNGKTITQMSHNYGGICSLD